MLSVALQNEHERVLRSKVVVCSGLLPVADLPYDDVFSLDTVPGGIFYGLMCAVLLLSIGRISGERHSIMDGWTDCNQQEYKSWSSQTSAGGVSYAPPRAHSSCVCACDPACGGRVPLCVPMLCLPMLCLPMLC